MTKIKCTKCYKKPAENEKGRTRMVTIFKRKWRPEDKTRYK